MMLFEPININEQYRSKEQNDLNLNKEEIVFIPLATDITCTISNSAVIPGINDKNSTIGFKKADKNERQSLYKE